MNTGVIDLMWRWVGLLLALAVLPVFGFLDPLILGRAVCAARRTVHGAANLPYSRPVCAADWLMVMQRLKFLAFLIALVALIGIVSWQRTKIGEWTQDAATLRGQLQQTSLLANSKEPPEPQATGSPGSNSVARLMTDEFHELLKLRGQVAILKQQLAEAAQRETNQQAQHERIVHEQVGRHMYAEARQLDDDARLFHAANYALNDLEKALDVPEWVTKLEPREGLRDDRLKQYWPYLDYKARFEEIRAAFESSVEGHKKAIRNPD